MLNLTYINDKWIKHKKQKKKYVGICAFVLA